MDAGKRLSAALVQIETGDRRLLAGIAGTMEEAARRSGDWLVCRPGCTQCCIGPFEITQLDALRLRKGLAGLEATDPARAARVRARVGVYVDGDESPCPALDPETGWCDLYEARPIMCRTFGPVTRIGDDSFAACELCYEGATDEEMAACAVEIDEEGLERELLAALDTGGLNGTTTVAGALTSACGGPLPGSASPARDCTPRTNRSEPGK